MDFEELIGNGVPLHEKIVMSNWPGVMYFSKKSGLGRSADLAGATDDQDAECDAFHDWRDSHSESQGACVPELKDRGAVRRGVTDKGLSERDALIGADVPRSPARVAP